MYIFEDHKDAPYDFDYPRLTDRLNELLRSGKDEEFYRYVRMFTEKSLFFFCYFVLGIRGLNHPWLVARVLEVQENHDNTLDLWFREAFKSTLCTYALSIWQIIDETLSGNDTSIGIFSHTRGISKGFLRRIKHTLETNMLLHNAWPDVFYADPTKESPKWSEDDGLVCKRRGSYAESTVEAWGVVDAQPTGKHFDKRKYDDVVTVDGVSTLDQMAKTRERFALSHNLGRKGGEVMIIGTRYDIDDLYGENIASGEYLVRTYPCRDVEGNPILHTEEELQKKFRDMGNYVFNCQMMLEPLPKGTKVFHREWFQVVDDVDDFKFKKVVRYWDRASTEGKKAKPGGSWTVGLKMGLEKRGYFVILGVERFQGSPMEVESRIKRTAEEDGKEVLVGIEQDPAQAGKAEAQYQARSLAGWTVKINPVRESKGVRCRPFAAQAEAGNVLLLRGPWNSEYLKEMGHYDGSKTCQADQVDTSSGAFLLLTESRGKAGSFKWE